jgi:hypothetical protein
LECVNKIAEIRPVQKVEGLSPKLQASTVEHIEVLHDGHVEIDQPGPTRELRGDVPNVPTVLVAKALVLKYFATS